MPPLGQTLGCSSAARTGGPFKERLQLGQTFLEFSKLMRTTYINGVASNESLSLPLCHKGHSALLSFHVCYQSVLQCLLGALQSRRHLLSQLGRLQKEGRRQSHISNPREEKGTWNLSLYFSWTNLFSSKLCAEN